MSGADAAIVFVGTSSGEGHDRKTLGLGESMDALVSTAASLNPATVAVVATPGAVLVGGWVDAVAAALVTWLPGAEGGHAIADVLFGTADPGGRLAVSLPHADNEVRSHPCLFVFFYTQTIEQLCALPLKLKWILFEQRCVLLKAKNAFPAPRDLSSFLFNARPLPPGGVRGGAVPGRPRPKPRGALRKHALGPDWLPQGQLLRGARGAVNGTFKYRCDVRVLEECVRE